jgi:hypothetical protein
MVCLYGRLDVPGSYSVARKAKLISHERWDRTGRCWRSGAATTQANALTIWNIVDGRARHSDAQEELAANLRTETNKIPLVSRDSPLVFFGYSDFTDAVDFKEKQKVPHSYSRAEENARFADGVRDDEIKKDYINPEIALIANFQLLPIDIRVVYNFLLLTKTFE